MTKWTALLLAGSRPEGDAFARSMMQAHKALVPVAGEPMVLHPLRALLASPEVSQIIVLTQNPADLRPILPDDERVIIRASASTIAETIFKLISNRAAAFPVLVTTADHAVLDRKMIREFTSRSDGADLAVGVVERRQMLERFPSAKRTWLKFRGGSYSGANLFAFGSPRALPAIALWRSVEQSRKKGWRVLAALGPALFIGAVLRMRTLEQSVDSIGRKLGLSIRIIEMSDPAAAIDVDKAQDHALVESILAGQA